MMHSHSLSIAFTEKRMKRKLTLQYAFSTPKNSPAAQKDEHTTMFAPCMKQDLLLLPFQQQTSPHCTAFALFFIN